MRPISVVALCLISAAAGAGIDRYWDRLPPLADLDWSRLPSFTRADAPRTVPAAAGAGKVEVLGDRVKCDVRYTELKIPRSEYRAFFDRCMGNTGSASKTE